MIATLAQQTVLLPGVLSLLALVLGRYYPVIRRHFVLLLVLCWVPLYLWIIHIPNFPPRQAGDWFWIFFIISALIPFIRLPERMYNAAWSILLLVSSMTILWPVLSYDARVSTHGAIWAEVFVFLVVIIFCLTLGENHRNQVVDYSLNLLLVNLSIGIVTIISGSLLIGMLCLSFATMHGLPAFYEIIHRLKKSDYTPITVKASLVISVLFLLAGRSYAEIPLGVFLTLSLALVLPLVAGKYYRWWLPLLMLILAFGVIGVLETSASNDAYY